ncbi:hypothetical protein [Amycolatopsis azurea]|uniref:Uncharacterized protein n=1 Tax=Amycolatopsis azurea DSM 43854 TaxID=1238180 RepID=M2PVS6_9PSEU|nr:hypothetical protein [Amycolatopsis azurea]EMD23695.1 hypothetical protein C791_6781 [Amycolatopsis azurea DSM 43854]
MKNSTLKVTPETPEECEEAAIRAVDHNKPDDAMVYSNLAISKAISRLTDAVDQQKR